MTCIVKSKVAHRRFWNDNVDSKHARKYFVNFDLTCCFFLVLSLLLRQCGGVVVIVPQLLSGLSRLLSVGDTPQPRPTTLKNSYTLKKMVTTSSGKIKAWRFTRASCSYGKTALSNIGLILAAESQLGCRGKWGCWVFFVKTLKR